MRLAQNGRSFTCVHSMSNGQSFKTVIINANFSDQEMIDKANSKTKRSLKSITVVFNHRQRTRLRFLETPGNNIEILRDLCFLQGVIASGEIDAKYSSNFY